MAAAFALARRADRIVVLVPTWLAMVDLRAHSPWLLLLLMSVAWISDISAYFAGRRFGKHKLAPSISPGKTWEGVVGAVLAVSVYVALWGYAWQPFFPAALQSARFGAVGMLVFLWLLTAAGISATCSNRRSSARPGSRTAAACSRGMAVCSIASMR